MPLYFRWQYMQNIKVFPYGLWRENTTKKLCLMDVSSSLVLTYNESPEYTNIKVVSLDSFVEENNLKKIAIRLSFWLGKKKKFDALCS